MPVFHRDRRLSDASQLQCAIDSLTRVDPLQRPGFIHDRLVSAIDEICDASGSKPFSDEQVIALKDIAFRIVYIMDPLNKRQKSFIKRLWYEFKNKSAMEQIATIFSVCTVAAMAVTGLWTWGDNLYSRWIKNADAQVSAPMTINRQPSSSIHTGPQH